MCKTNRRPFNRVYKTSSHEFKRHGQSILPIIASVVLWLNHLSCKLWEVGLVLDLSGLFNELYESQLRFCLYMTLKAVDGMLNPKSNNQITKTCPCNITQICSAVNIENL